MTDLQVAREMQHDFDTWLRTHDKELKVDMSVQVLNTGFWPTYKVHLLALSLNQIFIPGVIQAIDLALPNEMNQGVVAFKEFYEETIKHRSLPF